jgi:hypothetical protein
MIRTSFFLTMTWTCFISSPLTEAIAPLAITHVTLGGIINQDSDDTLAFTPDRNTVFFDRSDESGIQRFSLSPWVQAHRQ